MVLDLNPRRILLVGLIGISLAVYAESPAARQKGELNFLTGFPAVPQEGLVNVVVEIPAGTNEKWQVSKTGESLEWELKDGKPRVVQYLSYPANYGIVPRTLLPKELGGDGDPLDIVLLGPSLKRGTIIEARAIGVLRLLDDNERDDKILAVPNTGPLSQAADISSLHEQFPGVLLIIETWFTNYKGTGRLESRGFENAKAANSIIAEASDYFEENSGAAHAATDAKAGN